MIHPSKTLLVSLAAIGLAVGTSAVGASPGGSGGVPNLGDAFVRGQAALDRVGERLPEVAAKYGMTPGELRRTLLEDPTLAMDRSQRLAYFDVPEPADAESLAGEPAGTSGDAFGLASLPGASKTIYLDFDGHVTTGTSWNSASGRTSITSPPYSRDGDTATFNAEELQIIRDSWAVVAEDFAPWNVNVTTIDPGVEALRRSGTGDTDWGVRVVITGEDWDNCGCGGFAYLGSFDDTADEPVFVFNTSFVGVSEAASHEVGHALLLNHDGLASGTTYYQGHDTVGTPGWAPIMGASYYEPVTQWSRQEYFGANNTGEDDTAIIGSLTNGNNFGVRPDDHGNDTATATPLTTQEVNIVGIISTRTDVDVFAFTTTGGAVTLNVDVAAVGPNLDAELTLRNSGGGVVARDNVADGLTASIAVQLPAGTFTVTVDGVGVGTPGVSPPSGYSDYASLGQFTLRGTIDGIGGPPPPDTQAPAAPTGVTANHDSGDVVLTWSPNVEIDLARYDVGRSLSASGPFATVGSSPAGTASFVDQGVAPGSYHYVVRAIDTSGNPSGNSTVVNVDVPVPPVDLTTNASGETPVAGTVTGTFAATNARGGATQTITEVASGGKPNSRHDLAEHRWTIPASQGNQTLTVVANASTGADADSGFAVEYSVNGTTWIRFTGIPNGGSVDATAPIGAPTGTVWVRVIDTNRSAGNTSFNRVTVDFIEISGDGEVVQPPTATMTVATITTSAQSAGRGAQYGVATVQVSTDLGAPVSGAEVTVRFSGSFSDLLTGVTGSNGSVTLRTGTAAKQPTFGACVEDVTAVVLPYEAGTEAC